MFELLNSHYNYFAVMLLLGIGLYMLIESRNLVKKVIGMNIFQTGIFLFFITLAFRTGGNPPIIKEGGGPYVSPLPHVLILTAIVVGVSLTAVALALIIRIYTEYGTLDEDKLKQLYYD
ncbi:MULTISPECIES: cation:proton antiporter subunit C [Haloarcula]|jgi:multicomponent Na+:H+ antiporter subunit C|uniref:Cation:proton antiporter n=5 Tax=Haloarcula TaxID=2237 RepID=A0A847URS3_HALAR|nr:MULTISPECIES: cation:proton antiporter subunit C [Haloarcula]EMA12697.1 monovalent cation/H+ antiporter subunit C [Haloarcula sinaiiensis ATCC 33800]EMA22106.1 monovalent cation/H+ antiporter subunit C [Haloarcula argentinensis DSM 12282]MDS0252585.1 cation:proton antiporter subunit C [Haloarcula argentinensis]NHN63279.1 cation:proton antiporter subunit C [Haloarcula sp. JP-Z28]NLV14944.1 cation:proton antiporter [Haloarcula argentinensis]